ncbi:hypothetical protein OKA05_08815 [Luteolibacter arcticus]|uniref:DUF2330 domain-containing protein n=1 Tax=Luteolibacter arcticus TaxID=1581411 RepID=A0ABT3GGE9_9BACT|nr:hypothetical protein [Luteolibacter arcticus]MCW1922654.1 hypothetical protein [Luteolibacter arcticus]
MKKPLLLTLLASLGLAAACEVPVFRFALERWPSDPLQVEVTADSSVGPEGEAALKWLQNKVEGEEPSNLMVKFLDPDGPIDSRGSIRLLPAGAPPGAPNVRPLWEGSLNEANARRLSGSPARAAIGKQLLEGTSAVWVVVSRGDKDADDKAVQTVSRGMNRAMQQLNLPSGVIRPEEAAQRLAENPQATMDDVLRTKLPLRIAFSIVLVRADDAEEDLFREMVANLSPPEGGPGEPLIAPIFGRGRILSPAPASMIDEDRVYEACAYLCGACACMVKQQNPGIDLPFRINWDAHIEPHLASIDRPLGIPGPETVQYGAPQAVVVPTKPAPKILLWVALGLALFLPLGLWLGKRLRS